MTNLTGTQKFGRAQNAIGSFFDRKLVVSKIFFDAIWDGSIAHVLAIDRAGIGDVYLTTLSAETYQASPDAFDFVFSSELETLVSELLGFVLSTVMLPSEHTLCPQQAETRWSEAGM